MAQTLGSGNQGTPSMSTSAGGSLPSAPWPKLHKHDVMSKPRQAGCFEFCWPQPGDVDPSIFAQGARVSEVIFVGNHADLKGIQVKLSNGIVSPMFTQVWGYGNENNHLISFTLGDTQIGKVSTGAW